MVEGHRRFAKIVLSVALVIHHLLAILRFATVTIDGRWFVLADDDVMITLRYAKNLATGRGLVLNPGEHVEGFTNPLLVFIGAGLHLLHVPAPFIPLALDAINLGLSLAILWMLIGFWQQTPLAGLVTHKARAPEGRAGVIAGALYVLLPQHLFFAYAGFEVYLEAAILLYCVSRLARGAPSWRWTLLLGLLPLTHATALIAWLVLCGVLLVGPPGRRLARLTIAVAPTIAYELFRLGYYGEALPNTYWLKVGAGSLAGGLVYVRGWAITILPMLVLGAYPIVLAARAAPKRAGRSLVVVTILIAHVAAVVALGGDYFPQSRFLFPCSVLLALMAGRGGAMLVDLVQSAGARRALPFAAAGVVVMIGALAGPLVNYLRAVDDLAGVREWNVQHVTMGLALRESTREDAVIALLGLGAAAYYSERRCIDMLGKADRHIARTKPHPQRRLAHNKSDFGYVMNREPDFVEMRRTPEELGDVEALTDRSLHSPHGHADELALDPIFRAAYLPHPVQDARGRFTGFYARSDALRTVWE